jgi:hypothetical protein
MDSSPILAGLGEVTSKWTRQRKAEERSVKYVSRRDSIWTRPARTFLKDICWEAMPEIWMKASGGGRLPTHWRQMFYVARKVVDDHPDSDRPLLDTTFKQILENYLKAHSAGWDILYGARGVLKEPHDSDRNRVLPLSTADVRNYLRTPSPDGSIAAVGEDYPTHGPANCYAALLICEKEGFDELLQAEEIHNKYDLALMSTKGISARAARELASRLEVQTFTLHDFDKNGFVMAAGFPFATDIGLRLTDVHKLGLSGEQQQHRNVEATWQNLLKNGASEEEADFISDGTRVELNELPGDAFIEFVENKLEEYGVEKVIPSPDTLASAWRRAKAAKKINRLIERVNSQDGEKPPADLEQRVRKQLDDEPELSWSEALLEVLDQVEADA